MKGALAAIAVCLIALGLGAGPAAADLLHFTIDPGQSEMTALVAQPLQAWRGPAAGSFRVIKGEIWGDTSDPASAGRVSLVIDAASYHSGTGMRDRAVERDALEADRFPTISFESTGLDQVTVSSGNAGAADVVGNLTLHGTTRRVKAPVYAYLDDDGRLIADGETTFHYEDFGVRRLTMLLGTMKVGAEVTVRYHVVANPDASPKRSP